MDPQLNEFEQVEQIKQWWNKYGNTLIIGVVLGLGTIYGWDYWQNRQSQQAENASIAYQKLTIDLDNGDLEGAISQGQAIVDNYGHSSYAVLSQLLLSGEAVKQNDIPGAKRYLQWVRDHGTSSPLVTIANLRLARLWAAEGASTEALELLDRVKDKSFLPLVQEIRGDIFLAEGQTSQATDAYRAALADDKGLAGMRPLLLMKLNQVKHYEVS